MADGGGDPSNNLGDAEFDRELADWLPQPGDQLFVESHTGCRLDPLGFTAHDQQREPTGRWQLYADGYLAAGDRLVEGCSGQPYEDALIYPILALYRHHLELQLKYVLRCCPGCTAEIRKWLTERHGLKTLWQKITEVYPRFSEWASPECTGKCFQLVEEFDVHDPNSQSSRYPIDRNGSQTLSGLKIVNLPTFKRGIHKISHYLATIIEQIGQEREWEEEMASW